MEYSDNLKSSSFASPLAKSATGFYAVVAIATAGLMTGAVAVCGGALFILGVHAAVVISPSVIDVNDPNAQSSNHSGRCVTGAFKV